VEPIKCKVFTDILELFETKSYSVTENSTYEQKMKKTKDIFLNLANSISLVRNLSFHQWHCCWYCWLSSLHKGKPAA